MTVEELYKWAIREGVEDVCICIPAYDVEDFVWSKSFAPVLEQDGLHLDYNAWNPCNVWNRGHAQNRI